MNKTKSTRRDFLIKSAAVGGAVAAGSTFWGGCSKHTQKLPSPCPFGEKPKGNMDVTFYAIADTHLGYGQAYDINRRLIETLNNLPGSKMPLDPNYKNARPDKPGSSVIQKPRGVIIAGDLTEDGKPHQWEQFESLYGLTGKEGLLKYPVLECTGNHDRRDASGIVPSSVAKRHGSNCYRTTWDDLQVLCVDVCPGKDNISWLRDQLLDIGSYLPVIIFYHYNMDGPYSHFWSIAEKKKFIAQCEYFNVLGIFHGHFHPSEIRQINGINIFNTGACKHSCHYFMVCRVTDERLAVGAYYWDKTFGTPRWELTRLYDWKNNKIII